ncbi:MAG: tRNA-specific 2-thiouridylase [Flavobacteriaceae bacterium]|jgi:tRNA-specific 2-thiouridylase
MFNFNRKKYTQKVWVGVSGGVDSAVTLGILKKEGYDVVGVFMNTWAPDWLDCPIGDERRDAIRVCAHFDVPFLEFDAIDAYREKVGEYMIEEYRKGRTPNPDVMCNREVKFGVFYDEARKNNALVATGHYAGIQKKKGKFNMLKGRDISKDQSYFLWTLSQEKLSHTLFPLGKYKKTHTRKLAKKWNIPVADKKDSQGVCFLGHIDIKKFLGHYIEEKRGDVLSLSGEIIGFHDGSRSLTLEQRHGFTIAKKSPHDEPYYIVSKDLKKNTITIAHKKEIEDMSHPQNVYITDVNWCNRIPTEESLYACQIRYHGREFECFISLEKEKTFSHIYEDVYRVKFSENAPLISSGQSIVVYDKKICMGGGIVI